MCLSVAVHAADPELAAVQFERCTIGDGHASLVAECATLDVPLDPRESDAASLTLALARLPARGRNRAADPLVFIAGGPGQSAVDTFASVASAFRAANRERDIVLVDQRGTGGSMPLDCPTDEDSAASPASDDELGPIEDAARQAQRCLDSLTHDTRLFTTSIAVQDLEQVRRALAIDRWNVYGVSYGTRVALHYARRYPTAVRSLILDAVVPPGTPLGPDIAPLAQRALDLVLQRCQDTDECAAAFPNIADRTTALLEQLDDAPVTVAWEDIANGDVRRDTLERADLAVTLRLLAYSAWGASLLPSMLDDAIEQAHFAPFARQANLQANALADTLSAGMHYSVICTEDLPFMPGTQALDAARDTFLGDEPLRAQLAACERWPEGVIDSDFHSPLSLNVPVLILSGEADPVTPPDYGDRLADMLGPRARHIVNAGQGHMQATLGCTPSLLAEFLQDGDAAALSVDCLERLVPPPFFVDANGPRP